MAMWEWSVKRKTSRNDIPFKGIKENAIQNIHTHLFEH